MERNRRIRYKEKIAYIYDCLREIEDAMPDPSGIILKGVFYDLSSAIEALMDMTAMLCKDLGVMPKGDYENIQSLQKKNIITKALASRLAKCNGLRNVLIHQYNGIDDKLVIDSVTRVGRDLKTFIKIVEAYLGES
jgi:uncharacterized protein YutE (UPF0331/DUF86 family)